MERKKDINPTEQVTVIAPTELTLFRNNQVENSKKVDKSEYLRSVLLVNYNHAVNISREFQEREKKVRTKTVDVVSLEFEHASYISASASYLKLWEEFSKHNISQQDFKEYFIKCFYINSETVTRLDQKDWKEKERANMEIVINSKSKVRNREKIAARVAGKPPVWFNGNTSEWIKKIATDSIFSALFDATINPYIAAEVTSVIGFTEHESIPDWMENLDTKNPSLEEVELELSDDQKELGYLKAHTQKMKNSLERMRDFYFDQFIKTVKKSEEFRRSMMPVNTRMSDIVSFLHAVEDRSEFKIETWGSNPSPEDLRKSGVGYAEWIDKYYKSLNELPASEEFIAIWMENKFKEAGLNVSTIITEDIAEELTLFEERDEEKLKTYKESNKKMYYNLNNEINPLLRLASVDEREYLKQLIKESQGLSLESVIWEFSYLISRNQFDANDRNQEKSFKEIKRTGELWLRRNWMWAFNELRRASSNEEKSEERQFAAGDGEDQEIEKLDQQNEEDAISEKEGTLSDWDIQYSTNRRIQGSGLVNIHGNSLDEKQERLEELLLKEGHQVSIKSSSVINALDWVATIPDEIYYMMPKMNVDGVDFTKVKRGAVRLLLKRDKENKNIVFFLHQKKAMNYRF